MKSIIMLDGGAGRILSSIPAFLKYYYLNPNKEWYILINWLDQLFWGIPELQEKTINLENKNVFENYFWDADEVITLEPYRLPRYYRQEISMAESFDILLNGEDNFNKIELPQMQMNLSTQELLKGYDILEKVKKEQGKEKTIVIQPYGSTAQKTSFGIIDETVRSIPEKIYLKYVDYLKEEYNIIYMGYDNFHDGTTYLPKPNLNLREWAAVIAMCDYFIGCDSCGQHMAKCFDKKSSVFIAGTHEKNVSYPNDFHIIKRDNEIYPTSMRISNIHSHLSYRLNEQRLNFTDDEISKSIEEIQENIEN